MHVRPAALIGAVLLLGTTAGCGAGAEDSTTGPLTVYVSAPLRGEDAAAGRDVADGARLALEESGGTVGEVEVELEMLNAADGPGNLSGWSPAAVGRNARAAAQDTAAIAYIGDVQSGATRVSLPITNQALVPQVSPGATAMDLVAPLGGGTEVPDDLQPSGERTFVRVIPDDGVQAETAARWAKDLGARRVTVVSDGSAVGDRMAEEFTEAAEALGVSTRRAGRAQDALGGFVYHSGEETSLVRGRTSRVVEAAQSPQQLPPAGREFARAFEQEYGRKPGPHAAYGYEAMALVLDAVERAGGEAADRRAVRDELLATTDRDSVLGTYSITPLGNTTLDALAGYRERAGRFVFEEALTPP